MCYGTNCGREGAFGTCYHPEDCIMRAIERDAEENLAVRLARDTALSREHFPCPNCLEQGERHSLTCENGLFTCPECGGECDAAELIALYDDNYRFLSRVTTRYSLCLRMSGLLLPAFSNGFMVCPCALSVWYEKARRLSSFDDSRQTPGRANPRRGVHIHTFQVPHGSGRRVFAAPFMRGRQSTGASL